MLDSHESETDLNGDSTRTHPTRLRRVAREYLLPLIAGGALACGFWYPLLFGAGLIGGDTYNYFFPLKDFYANGLKQGEIRLWHPGIGNGVPVLGESQTGAFYPPYLLAYRFLDLNNAYNAILIGHYILAFYFAYRLGRRMGIGGMGSLLVALVYVYGWFAPRACLEWAIVAGAWMPGAVLAGPRYIDTGRIRWAAATSGVFGVHLLAGHFNLAWVTLLSLATLAMVWPRQAVATAVLLRRKLVLAGFVVLGFGLAGVQLAPAWELKTHSQRDQAEFKKELREGIVPLAYLAQAVAPWRFYYPDADATLRELGAATNKVEAHLYFGLAPLALAAWGLFARHTLRDGWPWLVLGAVGLLLATGAVMGALADVPGFSYFRYPGRYGVMTQLAVAVLAGMALDRVRIASAAWRGGFGAMVLLVSGADLFLVGRHVQYLSVVERPTLDRRDRSEVFRQLAPSDRVLAPDGNTLALSSAACVPPYLGIGPAQYYRIWQDEFPLALKEATGGFSVPNVFQGEGKYSERVGDILRRTGLTHILTFQPLPKGWPVTLVWSGSDEFLHARWGRPHGEPLYLYAFDAGSARAYLSEPSPSEPSPSGRGQGEDPSSRPAGAVRITEIAPHRVTLQVNADEPALVVLTDLAFPGWTVEVDGRPTTPVPSDFARKVHVDAGLHEVVWRYWPWSVFWGTVVSGTSLLVGIALCVSMRRDW